MIDDLPAVGVSRLRASGAISPADAATTVAFHDGSSFVVGLSHLRFPNGGGWSFFVCSCGRRARAAASRGRSSLPTMLQGGGSFLSR
jgi:hypothetical protein